MKVLAVVPHIYNTSPGQRYRIEQWEPILRRLGAEITYAPFESAKLNKYLYTNGNVARKAESLVQSYLKRFQTLLKVKKFDVLYLYREASLIGPAFFEKLYKTRKIPVVYDFDDAIFLPTVSEANSKFAFLKSPDKVKTNCRLADEITVGNEFLAEYARQYNQKVTVIPSTIDTGQYLPVESYGKNPVPVIVWSGSITTLEHLRSIQTTLQELARTEKFKLRVIGATDFELAGVEIENVRWQAQTEAADLAAGDIGIMPLPDDRWSKGKCGMKALQYMGMGIPTVCSNVGANGEIVSDGENGFLASNNEEWLLKLKNLLHSVELRSRIGRAGRETVVRKYSAEIHAPRMFEVLKKSLDALKNG